MRILVFLAIAGCAFGQHSLNPAGQGSILHPGVPLSGPPRARPRPGGATPYRGGTIYIPYGVPFDPFYSGYGSGYGYDANYYGPGYGPQGFGPQGYGSGYGYDPNAYGAQPPGVVINQNFQPDAVHPMLHDYSNTPLPPSGATQNGTGPTGAPPPVQVLGQAPLRDDQPTIFLIAMKDHTIYPVIAYWVDKDTLNYVTVDTTVKRVPMAQVDRDLSIQLNDQRNVEFKLPAPASAR